MNRLCLTKSGKWIETQTGGDDRPDLMEMRLNTLKQNALNAGYKEEEIEVKWVTEEEWGELSKELSKPTPEQIEETKIQAEMQRLLREQAIIGLKIRGEL